MEKTTDEKRALILDGCKTLLTTSQRGLCFEVTEDDGCPWVDNYKINDFTDPKTIEKVYRIMGFETADAILFRESRSSKLVDDIKDVIKRHGQTEEATRGLSMRVMKTRVGIELEKALDAYTTSLTIDLLNIHLSRQNQKSENGKD